MVLQKTQVVYFIAFILFMNAPNSYCTNQAEPTTEEEIVTLAESLEAVCQTAWSITPKQSELLVKETLKEDDKRMEIALMRAVLIAPNNTLDIASDFHGDKGPIIALLKKLESEKNFSFKTFKLAPGVFVALLGDYIDRGPSSISVLALATRLLQKNPQQVILLRGNHETKPIMEQFDRPNSLYTQIKKITKKTKAAKDLSRKFLSAFAHLPLTTFVTWQNQDSESTADHTRVTLSHGGINPYISEKNKTIIQNHLKLKKNVTWILDGEKADAYLWSDFNYTDDIEPAYENFYERGAGYKLFKNSIEYWNLITQSKTLVRGHQQENLRFHYYHTNKNSYDIFTQGKWLGLASFWDDQAHTVNIAPNTNYYNEDDDFLCNTGTIVRLYKKPDNFENGKNKFGAKTLACAPNLVLEPIYYHPQEHNILNLAE